MVKKRIVLIFGKPSILKQKCPEAFVEDAKADFSANPFGVFVFDDFSERGTKNALSLIHI